MKTIDKIPSKMKAVMNYAPFDYRYEEIDTPYVSEEEILVKVLACGICAGDIKSFHGAEMIWGGGIFPPWQKAPVVPGHEFIGRVAAIGDEAAERTGLSLGDMAIAEQIVPCGECVYCNNGYRWLCEAGNIHGHIREVAEGGMAEYMRYCANDVVYKVPDSIDLRHAAMIEPLSCAVHAVERADIRFGDVVVVAGLGPIGLCILQLVKLKHPSKVIAIDTKPKRLALGLEYGADVALDALSCDVAAEVKCLTGDIGCDTYIHTSGNPKGVIQGLEMLRKRGVFVEFSVFMDDTAVNWSIIGDRKELDIRGAHISGNDGYRIAIDMLSKKLVDVSQIITHSYPLHEFIEAFKTSEAADESIKTILLP